MTDLEKALAQSRRTATDRAYMLDAYYQMLGPKGRQVADAWREAGIVRYHADWATDPLLMHGEDVAQVQLDVIEAEKTGRVLTREELSQW